MVPTTTLFIGIHNTLEVFRGDSDLRCGIAGTELNVNAMHILLDSSMVEVHAVEQLLAMWADIVDVVYLAALIIDAADVAHGLGLPDTDPDFSQMGVVAFKVLRVESHHDY